jgi:hypothetical protein
MKWSWLVDKIQHFFTLHIKDIQFPYGSSIEVSSLILSHFSLVSHAHSLMESRIWGELLSNRQKTDTLELQKSSPSLAKLSQSSKTKYF